MKDTLLYVEICNDLPSFYIKDFHKNVSIYENPDDAEVPYVSFYVWDYMYSDFDLERYVSQKLKKEYFVEGIWGAQGDNSYKAFPKDKYCLNLPDTFKLSDTIIKRCSLLPDAITSMKEIDSEIKELHKLEKNICLTYEEQLCDSN